MPKCWKDCGFYHGLLGIIGTLWGGHWQEAVFAMASCWTRDVISYNAIISACEKGHRWAGAMHFGAKWCLGENLWTPIFIGKTTTISSFSMSCWFLYYRWNTLHPGCRKWPSHHIHGHLTMDPLHPSTLRSVQLHIFGPPIPPPKITCWVGELPPVTKNSISLACITPWFICSMLRRSGRCQKSLVFGVWWLVR